MALRQIIKSFNLLNCLLIAVSLAFAYNFILNQPGSNVAFVSPPLNKKPVEKSQNEPPKVQTPAPMDYVVIADQNLFNPERRIPAEKKEAAALPKPEFILYGTLITPGLKVAYLEDKKAPVTTPGRGKRQTALKPGETLSGFTLKEISADRVVMVRGEETLSVLLDDPKSPKTREIQATGPHPPGIPGLPAPAPVAGQPTRPPMAGQPARMPVIPGRGVVPSAVSPGSPAPPSQAPQSIQPPANGRAFPSMRQFQ
jgi:hypothetical protein